MHMNMSYLMRSGCRMSAFAALLSSIAPVAGLAAPSTYFVPVGESRVYRLEQPIKRVAVGNPEVADYIMLNSSELYLLGKKTGATNLILWNQQGKFTSTLLQVSRNSYPIKQLLRTALPEESEIQIFSSGEALVLAGSVSNRLAAETAYRLVKAYLGGKVPDVNPESSLAKTTSASAASASIAGTTNGSSAVPVQASTQSTAPAGVVNLLTVRDTQQVRLEVRIAEVSKTYLQTLGIGWQQGTGNTQGSLMTGFVSNATLNVLLQTKSNPGNELSMDAERKEGVIKILAEPTLVAMSGEEGYFLVGGKVFTPTVTSNGAIDYVERTYGVGLRFTPTVLDSGRISLKVAPEVSEPLKEAVTAGTSTPLPGFKTSFASSTVQMNEGENLVIGGLLRDNLTEVVRAVPLLSDIPILGSLFRHTEKSSETTELMVIIRPTLIKASTTAQELPTDKFAPPSSSELFLEGKLQGSRGSK
uniref:Type II and III secretion system protein n=1 Tax=Chlorobium phaeovibrioides (strain DSM 265 / 1930) TaxID=290318 RepID=A4SDN2_CHLPM